MNNLKKFATEADYSAATLNYPAVSWVTSGDTVHFDKTAPIVVNDKVMMAWTTTYDATGSDITMYNGGSIEPEANVFFTSITLNDVDVKSSIVEGVLANYTVADTDYLAKYEISGTTVNDYFAGVLGGGFASDATTVEFLIPAQITEVSNMPNNVGKLVIEATTPPTTSMGTSDFEQLQGIYVPDESLTAYQSTWGGSFGDYLHPISEYQGNLPV